MSDLETKCVNTIRLLSADMVRAANSGHPGAPMGCAPMAQVLYGKEMNYNAKNSSWVTYFKPIIRFKKLIEI
jgi:transketolase